MMWPRLRGYKVWEYPGIYTVLSDQVIQGGSFSSGMNLMSLGRMNLVVSNRMHVQTVFSP